MEATYTFKLNCPVTLMNPAGSRPNTISVTQTLPSPGFAESALDQIGRLDPQTGELDAIKIPLESKAYTRRMGTDAAGGCMGGSLAGKQGYEDRS